MSLEPFEGSGSTSFRRRFWNDARNAVTALRKLAGRNVTVDEHPGKGTVINVADTSSRRHPTSGGSPSGGGGPTPCNCPPATGPITVSITGVTLCGCIETAAIVQVVDGHFPSGGPGINSAWSVPAGGGPTWDWQATSNNATMGDPYFWVRVHEGTGPVCTPTDDDAADLSACIISVKCRGGVWTVEINHVGFGLAFSGGTGCGIEGNPILNSLTDCTDSPRSIGHGGEAIISW